ncbi:MAG: hypothetical protein ACP5OP_04895 [Leptospirillia bacterium]
MTSRVPPPAPHHPPSSPPVLQTTELVVLEATTRTFRCRELGTDLPVTLRAYAQEAYPGTVITVDVLHKKHLKKGLSLTGNIRASRIDIPALKLQPLALSILGLSDVEETLTLWIDRGHLPSEIEDDLDWEDDRPLIERIDMEELPGLARDLLQAGPRPIFEMEQIIPGSDPMDDWDPILEASELMQAGGWPQAFRNLHTLLSQDLRCLDAFSHLGTGIFERSTSADGAVKYYEIGVALGDSFLCHLWEGAPPDRRSYLLPYDCIDNRPYLRCLRGLALCRWRQGRWEDASRLFTDLFWLDPQNLLETLETLSLLSSHTPWSSLP